MSDPDESAAQQAQDAGRAVRSDTGHEAAVDGAAGDIDGREQAQDAGTPGTAGAAGAADAAAASPEGRASASGSDVGVPTQVRRQRKRRSFWRELPILIAVALLLAVIIKTYAIQAFFIPSGSMENTLEINDRVLVNKIVYHIRDIHRGDIVVFNGDGSWDPGTVPTNGNFLDQFFSGFASMFGFGHPGDILIKRVIGVPGDHVACCDAQGRVTVNGVPLNEQSYLYPGSAPSLTRFNIVVPQGRLWVMGDNRYYSDDSRDHMGDPGGGTVPESAVIGRAFVIIWPLSRWRFLPIPATFQQPKLNASGAAASPAADQASASEFLSARLEPAGPALPLSLGFAAAIPITWLQRRVRMRVTRPRRRDPTGPGDPPAALLATAAGSARAPGVGPCCVLACAWCRPVPLVSARAPGVGPCCVLACAWCRPVSLVSARAACWPVPGVGPCPGRRPGPELCCPRDRDNWRTLRGVMTRHPGTPAAACGLSSSALMARSAPEVPSASTVSPAVTALAVGWNLYPRYPGYTPRRDGGLGAYEMALARAGFAPVAGIDEAGRGACAGPLVVAAVVLDPASIRRIRGLADSKLLSAAAREEAYAEVLRWALDWHVVVIGADQIDRIGLHVCNVSGMRRAFAGLRCTPGYVLTDGFEVRGLGVPSLAVWKGDRVTASVAAASVVAKVSRDRMMRDLHERYPLYGFDRHKGYNTDEHVRALMDYGPCPVHRYSFVNVNRAVVVAEPMDVMDPLDPMAAVDLSDPVAAMTPATAVAASPTGAWGENERRMDS